MSKQQRDFQMLRNEGFFPLFVHVMLLRCRYILHKHFAALSATRLRNYKLENQSRASSVPQRICLGKYL